MKQGDLSITKYFTKLHIVWDELENFRPDPTCSCTVRCTCLALTAFAQRKLKDRAIQFLRGLNEQYSNVRSHVLLMDPLPTISKIFSFVAQQERQLFGNNLMAGVSLEPKGSMINAVKSTCDFCGKTRHTENMCYKKHGVSSNYDGRSKTSGIKNGKTCTHCGKIGHTIDVCYRKHGFPP